MNHDPATAIVHNPAASRFETHAGGALSVADYELIGGVMWMTHTGVPTSLRGQGVAARLVEAALAHARAQGLKVRPSCSYVASYMRRHPETLDLLDR
ncbi:MAG: GNAT family N-acetyltransferase [Burkholderiaceae bacterium]